MPQGRDIGSFLFGLCLIAIGTLICIQPNFVKHLRSYIGHSRANIFIFMGIFMVLNGLFFYYYVKKRYSEEAAKAAAKEK